MIVDYSLEVLQENTIVQSMHVATTKLDLKKKRTNNWQQQPQQQRKIFESGIDIITILYGTLYKYYLMINLIILNGKLINIPYHLIRWWEKQEKEKQQNNKTTKQQNNNSDTTQ